MAENDERLVILEKAKKVRADLDAEATAAAGVKFNQAVVLSQIALAGDNAMVSRLGPALDRAVHTLTTAVSGLERKGLIVRIQRKGEDRRVFRINLTPAGTDVLTKLRETTLPLPK
jgi:DNA-binding MarR family transcriptional regulator